MTVDGIWTEKTTELLVEVIGKELKPKVPFFLRGLVDPTVRMAIKALNKFGGKHVPDKIDDLVNDAIVAGYEGDWDLASVNIGVAADMLVDIPSLDDEHEKQLFVSITAAIVNAIKYWISKNKG